MRNASHGRGRRRSFTVALVAAVVSLFGVAAATAATLEGGDESALSVTRFQKIDLGSVGLNDGRGASNWLPAAMSDKQVSVMLKMSGAPVATRGNLSASEKASVRAQLKAAQDGISKDIAKAGGTVVGQTTDAYNGVLVHVKQKDVAALAAIPGVTGIQPVGLYDEPTNVNGVPLVGGPAAWGGVPGLTGQGITVGVIDTGFDYTHADFGGAGTPAAYTAAHAASTTAPAAGSFDPNKFGGGYDFVGDDYDANVAGSTPQPDPNPLDCNGHGSHVAGTVAGYGVTAAGATYTGPYNAGTISGNSWLVGPGVAPKAKINSYRVFGCEGSSDVVILAIDKAVADHVNIISMSLGSPFGTSDQNDAELTAVNNAVQAGITVIASAGNSGPSGYIVGAPSTANRALSVAANDGSVQNYPGGLFHLTGGNITGINANGASFTSPLSAPVKVLRDAAGGVSLGCNPAEYVNQGVNGKIVVVQRGTCARVARAIYGQKAGAVAVVMINNSTSLPPFEGEITSNPDTGESYTVTIPFFGVRGLATTGADAQKLIADDGKTISIDATTVANTTYLRTASFSSGGPRNGDSAAKPEITAPGVSVKSALVGGGTKGTVLSGTSMACPMTSGSAALVLQAHPTWNGDQVKAALVNTASTAPSLIAGYNGRLDGTGFVQANKAAATPGLMTTADGLDSLSFGYVGGTGNYTDTRTFTITNVGSTSTTYNLTSSSSLVTLSAPSVTVSPGASQSVTATLTITGAQFAALPTASSFGPVGWGGVSTSRGLVTASPVGGGQNLVIQSLVASRGLSNVSASAAGAFTKQANNNVYTSSTTVSNTGVHAGTADFYAWGITDAKDLGAGAGQDIRDVGVQGPFSDGSIVFAVNGWNASSTQATQEYDIAIDLQRDGKADYFVVGADFGAVTTGTFDGRLASFTVDAKTGEIIDAFVAESPMNGSTQLLATTMDDLGLHASNTSFNYAVSGFSVFGGAVDRTAAATFDAAKPGVSTGQFESLNPGASASVPLAADYDKLQSSPALGWLVVSVDDAGGAASADEVALPALK